MARRCTCDRCDKPGPRKAGDCILCWQYHNVPAYRQHWDKPPAVSRSRWAAVPSERPAASPPCAYEGPIVSWCPLGNELLHVRHCLHPNATWDTCSRGHAKDADRSCGGCPLRADTVPSKESKP